jgi:hypothetical protein
MAEKDGRPLKYETPELLQADIDAYFEMCDEKDKPYTMSGLAIALDVDRKTITNYANREEFFPTIKRARNKVENYLEEKLFGNNVTGVIFNLKNNFGWRDKQDVEIAGKGGGPLKWETTYVKADVDKGNGER